MTVVISQSMYFPWVGFLEQIRLADIFVYYDDVQYSKGSFTNRVQVKTPSGKTAWMTVPLRQFSLGQKINEVTIQPIENWVPGHIAMLQQSFRHAEHAAEALAIANTTLNANFGTISELARSSVLSLAEYFELTEGKQFIDIRALNIGGSGSQRVFDIVKALNGTRYVTGHGAMRYLDHDLFEAGGIEVAYMQYESKPYQQTNGSFTPFVTALDLVAHVGKKGKDYIISNAVNWRKFKDGSNSTI